MIHIGVDEAGYGPTLGPLVVTAVMIESESDEAMRRAFETIRARGFRIGDSKTIYRSGKDLSRLSSTVLPVLCASAGRKWDSLDEIVADFRANDDYHRPWYFGEHTNSDTIRVLGLDNNADRICDAFARCGAMLRGIKSAILPAAVFNARMAVYGNKSLVLFESAMTVVQALLDNVDNASSLAYVNFDKQGGRTYYADLLSRWFPNAHIVRRKESPAESHYEFRTKQIKAHVKFVVKADRDHPEVSLASMISKWFREAFMEQFNAFWRQHCPNVRKTAGYPQDARRFLAEVEGMRKVLGIPKEELVRCA